MASWCWRPHSERVDERGIAGALSWQHPNHRPVVQNAHGRFHEEQPHDSHPPEDPAILLLQAAYETDSKYNYMRERQEQYNQFELLPMIPNVKKPTPPPPAPPPAYDPKERAISSPDEKARAASKEQAQYDAEALEEGTKAAGVRAPQRPFHSRLRAARHREPRHILTVSPPMRRSHQARRCSQPAPTTPPSPAGTPSPEGTPPKGGKQ